MRNLCLIFFLGILVGIIPASAQLSPKDLCREVFPAKATVLKAEGFDLLHLSFEKAIPSDLYLKENTTVLQNVETVTLSSKEVIFKIENTEAKAYLNGINECGEEYVLFAYNTKSKTKSTDEPEPQDDPILISKEMSDALVEYTSGKTPLDQFLIGRTKLNAFERAYVYQRSVLNDAKIDLDFDVFAQNPIQIVSAAPSDTGNVPPVNCDCDFFIVEYPVSPSNVIWENSKKSKKVYGYEWGYDDNDFDHVYDLPNKGQTWQQWNVMGPAGWHGLWTEGHKTRKNQTNSEQVSAGLFDNMGREFNAEIILNIICRDGQQLPSECGCERLVHFDYKYNSYLKTKATLNGGGGSKSSAAQAQDMVVVYKAEDGGNNSNEDFTLVKGLDFRVSATCEAIVNPAFWTNFIDLAGDLVGLYLLTQGVVVENPRYQVLYDSISQRLQIGDSTNVLQSIGNVITTSYYLPANCSNQEQYAGLEDAYTTLLYPNKRLRLGIMDMHQLFSEGMRSWHSEAIRSAEFGISAVIQPGDGGEKDLNEECCSPWIGVYIHTGSGLNNQAERVATNLKSYGLPEPIGLNDPETKGFAGYVQRPALSADCKLEVSGDKRNGKLYGNESDLLENSEALQFVIYPNPFADNFTFSVKNVKKDLKVKLLLGNSVGQIILEEEIQLEVGHTTRSFSGLSNLPKGVYTLMIKNENEIFLTEMLLKMN